MGKADRIIYGTPLMQSSGETMKHFTLAFTIKESKLSHLDKCIGWFAVLRTDLDFCIEQNIIHFAKRKPKQGEELTPDAYVNSQKIELYEIVGKIDDDMCKWRSSLAKGKTIVE